MQHAAKAPAQRLVVKVLHWRTVVGLVEHNEGVQLAFAPLQNRIPVWPLAVQKTAVGMEAPGKQGYVGAAPARKTQGVEFDGAYAALRVAAQFHMGGKVPQPQQGVDLIEPVFKFRKVCPHDRSAGVVQAVAHVRGRGKFVPQNIADNGPALRVKVHVHGEFVTVDVFLDEPVFAVHHAVGVLLAPACGLVLNGGKGCLPVGPVAHNAHPKAEEAHGWLDHAGQAQLFKGQHAQGVEAEPAVKIIAVEGAQQLAGQGLVFELCNAAH